MPPIILDFVKTLTDSTGMLQHSKFGTPRRKDGYTVDDNARALIAVAKYSHLNNNSKYVDRLMDTYLSFLLLMQKADGQMHNILAHDQRFMDERGSEDCMGRALWSCGLFLQSNFSLGKRLVAKEIFDKLLPWAMKFQSPRAIAFTLMGLSAYQKAFDSDVNPTKCIRVLANKLIALYISNQSKSWHWFEPYLTYCNGRLPQALFETYTLLSDSQYLKTATETLNFLLDVQIKRGIFVPIGNHGWYIKDGPRAIYDQQSVEAAVMTDATLSASLVAERKKFSESARLIFDWFYRKNTLKLAVYNSDMGACYDGITAQGLNMNMGAEATVCYLSSRIELELNKTRSLSFG